MRPTYYKLPIRFDSVFEPEERPIASCSEVESIDQFIELLLTTCPGEHKFNKNFGCRIWDMDFERVVSRQKWEDEFTRHIRESVEKFEKRLKDIEVKLEITEVAREDSVTHTTAIKKKVIVHLLGIVVSTQAPCRFKYTLYLGPLSTD